MISRPEWLSVQARLVCLGLCLSILLAFLAFIAPARAVANLSTSTAASTNQTTRPASKPVQEPTLQLAVGFDETARLDYWTPARITLQNDGPNFSGTLSATTYSGPVRSKVVLPWRYSEQVQLPRGVGKQISLLVPFYENPTVPTGVIATLSDRAGKVVATQIDTPSTLDLNWLLIGILSDQSSQSAGFAPLNNVTPPDARLSVGTISLDASTFPDTTEALSNFDMLVLDDFNTRSLDPAQLAALQTWVNRGGSLIEAGGAGWQRTLGALPPQLLPVNVSGTTALPAGTNLLPIGSPSIAGTGQHSGSLRQPVSISTATMPAPNGTRRLAFSSIERVLSSSSMPLIVMGRQGQGNIIYLAFDPLAAPLASWPGMEALWKGLLIRGFGDAWLLPSNPRYGSGPGALNLRGGLFAALQPGPLFPAWALIFLALGYILLLGPARYLLLRRLQRPRWSWRIVLSAIAVFSLLTYGLASYQKGATYDSISLIQVNQDGGYEHVTTYFDVFNPGQGSLTVQFPSRILAQPITIQPFQIDDRVASDSYHINFSYGQDGTALSLPDAGSWTLNPLVSVSDQHASGGIVSHLSIRGAMLVGTLTNTLATSLSDVYVLVAHSYVSLGQLPAGQSMQVNAPLHVAPPSSTLADQIAKDNHLSAPYFPYNANAQPKSDFQRHLALLSALSGEGYAYEPCGGPCSTNATVSEHIITAQPFGTTQMKAFDASDPLLISGAPATLIGWADQTDNSVNVTDSASVGGTGMRGTHENLFQIPLALDFSQSLPAGLVSGQVVNTQGAAGSGNNGAQITAPGLYSLPPGSITFELNLPGTTNVQAHAINNLEVIQPLLNSTPGTKGAVVAQARMYNWNTGKWDAIALNNNSFITTNVEDYLGTEGRVLLQVVNNDKAQGIVLLQKPSLNVNV